MATLLSPSLGRPRGILPAAVLASILLHLLMLAFLGREPLSAPRPPQEIVVALESAPEQLSKQGTAAAQQIVGPSDRENDQAPDGRAFLSDRNNSVEQETVARGIPNPGNPDGQAKSVETNSEAVAPPPSEPARKEEATDAESQEASEIPERELAIPSDSGTQATSRKLPGLAELLAPPAKVMAGANPQSPLTQPREKPPTPSDSHRDLLRAPPPAKGLLAGLRGTYDALPSVAAGNLTLLNTKADLFAPFVRRVGVRVFENLLILQRKQLDASEIIAARSFTSIRAILDADGHLRDLQIVDRSGSQAMDGTLLEALRAAAFDPNPPPAAANQDGEFEFIFRAQVVAAVTNGARGPKLQRVESRLQVGLN